MHALTGYGDRWSVKTGGTIRFMISSAYDREFALRFVRVECADPNPAGPGYAETPMPTDLDGVHQGHARAVTLGSYGTAALQIDAGALTIVATVWPTTPERGVQGIVTLDFGGTRLALCVGSGGGAMLEAGGTRIEVDRPMLPRRWYDLTATLAADGSMTLEQKPQAPFGDEGVATGHASAPVGGMTNIVLAALSAGDGHFNGKLERPTLSRGSKVLACWDFSIGIPTQIATDVGPMHADATLHKLPTRAMTGSTWTTAVHDWKSAPEQYGAIHFHDDDQGDLGWPASAVLTVPTDWPSGIYAAHISNEDGEDMVPFVVRPASPTADTVLLVPTFSYQVYGCHARPGRSAEIAERAAQWGALREMPDLNPQFGFSCYNQHSDGSGVAMVSQFRPMLDNRPRQMALMDPAEGGSGTARFGADFYIDRFLSSIGVAHDLITDHDLHAEGLDALKPYRLVVSGQHPEYHSDTMMYALEQYLAQGGRMMYLGGNGFYWRAEPSATHPDALEIRRAESGIRVWETFPGESYHAFGGGYGGLWRRIGRSSHKLVGISFSTQGRHLGFPYHFTEGIQNPRVKFMTEGLEVAAGEQFGERGYMGGGAVGFELDSVNPKYGTPPNALVVAKGIVIHPDYGPVNEDMLVHHHPLPQEDWSCADMTFFETASGGAVFSVGSMTYAGSLLIDGGRSVLGRLTANVVQRFRDPAPFQLP